MLQYVMGNATYALMDESEVRRVIIMIIIFLPPHDVTTMYLQWQYRENDCFHAKNNEKL
jgi:hypothetical protein